MHLDLEPESLKRVESHLVSAAHVMEDAVIEALNRKRPRPNTARRDQFKDTPSGKRVEHASYLKTLPASPPKVGESSGIGLAAPPLSAGPKHRLPEDRLEHLTPYFNEFARLVSKKDLEDFNRSSLGEMVRAMQWLPTIN